MKTDKILRALEKLTHSGRVRRMVELGREAITDSNAASVIAGLEEGDFYERSLALQSCFGSRDGEHVLRALSDPSRLIRGLALSLVPHVCTDEHVLAALETVPLDMRLNLLKRLAKRRQALVDRFLSSLEARDDPDLHTLLAYGSGPLVSRHVDRVLPTASHTELKRFARRHANLVAGWLQKQATTLAGNDLRLQWQVSSVLPILGQRAPDGALELVRTLAPAVSLGGLNLSALLSSLPNELVRIILDANATAPLDFEHILNRLDMPNLTGIIEQRDRYMWRQNWFPRLAPEKRTVVYQAFRYAWYGEEGHGPEGALGEWLVALLPREAREAEARRHLQLPSLQPKPDLRLAYAAFLPWEEARTALDPYLRSPDADVRSAAVSALISATRYHRSNLPEALEVVLGRRYEQDPVRGAILSKLPSLPPSIWREDHLAALAVIIRQALDAKDLSEGTTNSIEQLLVGLSPFHLEWSAGQLATLMRERAKATGAGPMLVTAGWDPTWVRLVMRRGSDLYNLGGRLSDRQVRRIALILLPVLQSWEKQEMGAHLLSFAQGLGERLGAFGELLDILERMVRDTREAWFANGVLDLFIRHSRDRADSIIPELLRKDGSFATLSSVYTYLHRHRQDLLTPFLGQKAYRGRFSTGKTRFLLPIRNGFHRWTSAQQRLFARALEEVIKDEGQEASTRLQAINALAALPSVHHTSVVELASQDNEDAVTQAAAITALSQLDNAGEGVPVLLEAMNDERARLAVYALRKATLDMPPDRALAFLRAVPLRDKPVTVAKEVVRLLGDIGADDALADLLALDEGELHRDVRLALLRALWNYLGHDEAWEILQSAASSEDPAVAIMAGRTTADRLSSEAQRRLVRLISLVLRHPEAQVRLAALVRCAQLPVADAEGLLLPRLLERLTSSLPDEVRSAAGAVFAVAGGQDAPAVARAAQDLLPQRRSLDIFVYVLLGELSSSRGTVPLARRILDVLQSDLMTATCQVRLALEVLAPEELRALLEKLGADGGLHADSLCAGMEALSNPSHVQYSTPAALDTLEGELSRSGNEQIRRLALAALQQAAEHGGWTSERLARLNAYRTDMSPLVAAAAQFTFPATEGQAQG
jgi:hypothetical protein